MNQNIWQFVTPQFDQFKGQLAQYSELNPLAFIDLQPRLKATMMRFQQLHNFSRILLVNAPDNSIYRNLICDSLSHLNTSDKPVIKTESLDASHLFDKYDSCNQSCVIQGLLSQAHGGFLVVSANLILANPGAWPLLKAAVLGEAIAVMNSDPKITITSPKTQQYDVKMLITGDQSQLADLDYLDADIQSGLALFGEIELELKLTDESITDYLAYLKGLCRDFSLPTLTLSGIERLLTAGARESEDQEYLPLCVIWHNQLLSEAAIESEQQPLEFEHIDNAIEHKTQREAYLPLRALNDILDGQVIIETTGEQVGQVNGLTVIDVPGHPVSYGEPARISCVIHFGDGDIADVERKAELGGNLHAKGMMIMQAFVSSALNFDEPLPYSASVVFEQSYCEVDGDSASLAELCSFVSALSGYPINQQVAVTGAVDQFGRVQAVGGLNEKIEGFYRVCAHHGFTGTQGVILPKTNLKHLTLHKDVVHSIKHGEFHIWPVSNVDEAIPLIIGKQFRGEDEDNVINKIAERIENFVQHEHVPGIVTRIKEMLLKH